MTYPLAVKNLLRRYEELRGERDRLIERLREINKEIHEIFDDLRKELEK